MFLIGPNMDIEVQGFEVDMEFETEGNEKCIKEFFAKNFLSDDETKGMYCVVLIKSGICKIRGSVLSLE